MSYSFSESLRVMLLEAIFKAFLAKSTLMWSVFCFVKSCIVEYNNFQFSGFGLRDQIEIRPRNKDYQNKKHLVELFLYLILNVSL